MKCMLTFALDYKVKHVQNWVKVPNVFWSVLGNAKWDMLEDSLTLSIRGSFWILSWKESDVLRNKVKFSVEFIFVLFNFMLN